MREIKKRDLFFVDSFTIGSSLGVKVALENDVPAVRRDIFLDNERSEDAIEKKLIKTIELAKEKGSAVAIGHSYPETVNVLKNSLPFFEKEVDFVTISEFF